MKFHTRVGEGSPSQRGIHENPTNKSLVKSSAHVGAPASSPPASTPSTSTPTPQSSPPSQELVSAPQSPALMIVPTSFPSLEKDPALPREESPPPGGGPTLLLKGG
ncbi:hypothetical protein Nepgr_009962 [Nepenthes gracilis]|uniref:Uncharacterized protein n=1 Tax=Nepenthes gracilis TaxID=150966 RepID=A0AAD3SBR5_NEPGR|nr:hypothetical protein Nepgr_009962 [Nepenthes gracilis]